MADATKLITFTRADLVEVKPTDWLIEDWLVTDTLAGLVAPSGACKSFLAVGWSCCIATGTLWAGRNVKQGAVFYLAGEGRSGLRKRIAAWEKATGVPIAGAPLYLADGLPFLCDELNTVATIESIETISEALFFKSGCEPALIVIDTVARAMAGANENAAEDMGRLIKAMDWLRDAFKGAAVLSVHHTGHDPGNQERGRGSSAYRAALDSEFVIATGDPLLTLKPTKCKDWRPPPSLVLRRAEIPIETPGMNGTVITETSLVLVDDAGALRENVKLSRAMELHAQGRSLRAIEVETGVSKSTLQRWLKEHP